MSRPSEQEIEAALNLVSAGREASSLAAFMRAMNLLRIAVLPRPVWPAKEVAACLSTDGKQFDPSNLSDLRGLPEPAQKLPRPTVTHPEKTMSLWFVDEIEEFAARRRAERGGT